jgi:hypothetical protein
MRRPCENLVRLVHVLDGHAENPCLLGGVVLALATELVALPGEGVLVANVPEHGRCELAEER